MLLFSFWRFGPDFCLYSIFLAVIEGKFSEGMSSAWFNKFASIYSSDPCHWPMCFSLLHHPWKTEMKHVLVSLLLLLSLRRCRISSSEVKVCPSTGNFVRKTYDFFPHHFEYGSTQYINQTILFTWTSKDQDRKNSYKYLIWFIH